MSGRGLSPVTWVVAGVVCSLISGCGVARFSGATGVLSGSGLVSVVAGENVWGNIVAQIGGRHVVVTSIISDPNTDPHEYESDAADAAAVARADLVFDNGIGYDDFMGKLLAASPRSGRVVLSAQRILGVDGPDPNPHVWYATAKLPRVAAAICAALSRLDPADSKTFEANAVRFDQSLRPILGVIARIRARYAGTQIAYTERVPGYLVQAAGLRVGVPPGFARAVEDGEDPSPADTVAFDTAVETGAVKVLLYNRQVTDEETTRIKQLAVHDAVPIVGVTETMPPTAADFQHWQLGQARLLLRALGG